MFLNELWCEMSITFWVFHSGNYEAVCFGTDFSYTKAHADRFRKMGRFDMHASRGDIEFFTRPGVQDIGHVGQASGTAGAKGPGRAGRCGSTLTVG